MPREKGDAEDLKNYEIYYWIFTVFFLIIAVPLQFYWPAAAPFRNTRQLPVTNPGALTSDLWSWGMIRESSYSFIYLIVLSGLFMVFSRSMTGKMVHMIVLLLFAVWFVVMGALDIKDIRYGQVGPTDPNFTPYNPARDPSWCCLYGLDLGTERICANTVVCSFHPLQTNGSFWFRVGMNAALLLFVIVDAIFTACYWSVNRHQYEQVEMRTRIYK